MPQTPTDPILARALAVTFVGLVMPVMVVLMWRMALGIDPLNLAILTKGPAQLAPDTPAQLRMIGIVVAGLGLLVGGAALNALRRARATGWQAALMVLAGLEVAAFGGAVVMTGDVAQDAIEEEQLP